MTPEGRVGRYLAGQQAARGPADIAALTGDASDRQYFRATFRDRSSIVLAVHAGPIDASTLPFINVAALLRQIPWPVPAILGHSDELGILALEDLGDTTLQIRLATAPAAERTALYEQAVALLGSLQRRGAELASDRFLPYRLAFDVEKLTWELAFFVQHFLEAHRGAALSGVERAALDEEWRALSTELAGEPRVLCHRDYHSRNLMVRGGRLHVVDFQDARMGPNTYDLASLLRDSYVELTDEERDGHLRSFAALTGAEAGALRRRFDLMSLQRNLKALGTFGHQATARRNPAYVQYVPRTLAYVRRNLAANDRFGRLHGLLAPHLPELA
jgi:hypothetical protein